MKKLPKIVKLIILVLIVLVCLRACGGRSARKPEPVPAAPAVVEEETTTEQEKAETQDTEEPEEAEEEPEPEPEEADEEPQQEEPKEAPASGIRPEFKEAMDSYEDFFDEYCAFMKKYQDNPTDLELLAKYADMLQKEAEMSEKFEAWEDDDLSDEELKYYMEVTLRIEEKLLDVAD